ncbi:EthD family reductase [Rhodobacteraceae bacterium CCMM004]|nr:EthD family reductase [Rhodobacteraceae bacterium CCMM004]
MIKLVALVRKRGGMSDADFGAYWLHTHAPLAAAIPGMRGYRINVAGDPGDMDAAPYDGSAEIWFDDRSAMTAGLGSEAGRIAGDDTANFADSVTFLVCEEHVILPGGGA